MKKLISLDFDGVVYDLDVIHKRFIKEMFNIDYNTKDATYWEYLYVEYPSIVSCWTNWDIYKTAPFIDGAIDFVEELKKRYGSDAIQFVTSSPESIQTEKTKMMEQIFGLDVIHVTKDKKVFILRELSLWMMLNIILLNHLENTSDDAILFDFNGEYGWSKDFCECERSVRAHSYKEVLNILEKRI